MNLELGKFSSAAKSNQNGSCHQKQVCFFLISTLGLRLGEYSQIRQTGEKTKEVMNYGTFDLENKNIILVDLYGRGDVSAQFVVFYGT
jgi:hypothetical protein